MEHRYRIYPANYAAKQCRPQKRHGWNYNPEGSTTPQAQTQEQAIIDALVKIYAVIELVVFYAVVNSTTVITEVLQYCPLVVWYAVKVSYAIIELVVNYAVVNSTTVTTEILPQVVWYAVQVIYYAVQVSYAVLELVLDYAVSTGFQLACYVQEQVVKSTPS